MRRTIWIATLAATALILSACSGGGGGITITIPERVDRIVEADTSAGGGDLAAEPSVIGSVTIPANGERVYRVNLPDSAEPGLFVYIDEPLPLYVYDAGADLVATSNSPVFFGSERIGLSSSATAGLDPQGITVAQTCPGACVILDNPGSGRIYVRVRNPNPSPRTITLYAVLRPFTDTNEDFDGLADAPVIEGSESGAIETIGDIDYYQIDQVGDFFLDYGSAEETGIDLVAEIRTAAGDTFYVEANEGGETGFLVEPGDAVRVYAENARAAVSGSSQYSVAVQ